MGIINNLYLNGGIVIFLSGTSFYLGLLAFSRNRKSQANLIFTRFAIATAFWIVLAYIPDVPYFRDIALLSAKLNYIVLLIVSYSLFEYPFVFPKSRSIHPFIRYSMLTIGVIICVITIFTNNVLKGLEYFDWGASYIDGDFAGLFYLYMMIGAFSAIAQYLFLWRRFNSREKTQVKLFITGLSIFLLTNIIVQSIVKPLITHTDEFYKIGNYSVIFMIGFTGYAIIKHSFLDIKLIVARTVSFTLLILYVTFVYSLLLVFALSLFTGLNLDNKTLAISAVLVLIMAFTIQPIRRGIEKVTDNIFFKYRYDAGKLLYSLALKMASTIKLDELMHQLLKVLISEMRLKRGMFILTEDHKIHQVSHEGYTENPEFDESEIPAFVAENKTLIFEELPEGKIREFMRKSNFTIAVPLRSKNTTIGLLVLEEKLSGDVYTTLDIQVLETFAPEAAVAIENARAYEEISRFNVTLREEVDRATKNLKRANDRLKEMDHLKDDFVSLASHELRTPMTAIKSYLWMALAGKGGPLNQKQTFYLQRSYNSVDRLIKLVNDMLNISRIESGRLTVQMKPVHIEQLVAEIVDEVKPRAKELGVEIVIERQGAVPQVLADADKIKEVIYNLIGNSMKFTHSGGKITVSFVHKVKMVEVTVNDTGSGILSEDLPKLFQKFGILPGSYVANQAVSGTGLGLYICRSLIELHGGKIEAFSEGKGKGSTFTFSLKVFTEVDLNKFNEKYKKQDEAKVGLIHTQLT